MCVTACFCAGGIFLMLVLAATARAAVDFAQGGVYCFHSACHNAIQPACLFVLVGTQTELSSILMLLCRPQHSL